MNKPTTRDVATAAGVSLATVDRVLNARSGVRQKTIEKVNLTIKNIGFVRDISAANLARRKEYRLVFILPDNSDQFISLIREAIEEANVGLFDQRTSVRILSVPVNDPHAIVQAMDDLTAGDVDGVAIMAPETPQVRDAILRLRSEGVSVVPFVSNQPNAECHHFVGINNIAAGRTAATLIGRFLGNRRGSVLVVTETTQSRDSLERRLGFDDALLAKWPLLQASPSLETYNDLARTEGAIASVFVSDPDVLAIYLMSSDMREVTKSLKKIGVPKDVVVIAHELTAHTREGLRSGLIDAVITQDVGHLVRSALRVLKARVDNVELVASQERIRIEIIMLENMPDNCLKDDEFKAADSPVSVN